jgi:hypothetical protein
MLPFKLDEDASFAIEQPTAPQPHWMAVTTK